jgi:hypothetical protein
LRTFAFRLSLAWLALVAAACQPNVGRDAPTPAAVARFDPASGIVPTPTDLVRDPKTGLLNVPIDPALSAGDRAVREYLNTLDGYPVETPVEVRFGTLKDPTVPAALDPATLTSRNVVVLDVTSGAEPVASHFAVLPAEGKLTVTREGGWKPGRTYLVGLRRGPDGLRTVDGSAVEAEAAFHFLRGRSRIDEHADVLPGDTREERQASADALEAVRQGFLPHFEALEQHGLSREDVAVLWSFTFLSPRAVARFDPAQKVVPLPTDLLRDEASGRLRLPIDDSLSPAERAFREYLNTLDGYPVEADGQVRFGLIEQPSEGTALDPVSLNEGSVVVMDITDSAAPERVQALWALEDEGALLSITRAGGWEPGRTYLLAVRQGQGGLRTLDNLPVEAQSAFRLLKGSLPIVEYAAYFPGETAEARLQSAQALEQVRQTYQPHFELLEAEGLARQDVAALWSFTTASAREHVLHDPLRAQQGDARHLPFPNDLLRVTGKVELPIQEGDSEEVQQIKRGLTGADGFSTSAALTFSASVDLDSTTLSASSVLLFDVSGPEPVEVSLLERRVHVNPGTVVLDPIDPAIKAQNQTSATKKDPRTPLKPGTRYVVVATSGLKGLRDGQQVPLQATSFTELLKLGQPVYADGRSQLSTLTDEQASWVEPLRYAAQGPLAVIGSRGVPRDQVSLVYVFTTLQTVPALRELNDLPYLQDVPLTIQVEHRAHPLVFPGIVKPMPNTALLVKGKIFTFDRLDPNTRARREDGGGEMRAVNFAMCIPASAQKGVKMPVAVFGHGLTTSTDLIYLLCDDPNFPSFGSIGMAAMAIDFPYHGGRSICTTDAHCNSGHTCATERNRCEDAQGNPKPLRQAPLSSTPWAQNIPQPASSGEGFVDLHSLFATRDHVHQAMIDLSAQIRSLRRADWKTALEGYEFDPADISYLGISLGGILGSNMTAADPRLSASVLNVPGAGFVQLVQDSVRFRREFLDSLAERGIFPDTDDFFRFENAARWIFDPSDPMNLVRHTLREPYAWVDPEDGVERMSPKKKVLIQMATPDDVVPNTSTFLLERMMGVTMTRYYPSGKPGFGGHIFLFDPSEQPENQRGLVDAFNFLKNRKQ